MSGEYWVGRESVADLVLHLRRLPGSDRTLPKNSFGLTPRELQVVATVVAGYPNKEIARTFTVSEETIKHHLTRMFDKVGAANRLELAMIATQRGLATSL